MTMTILRATSLIKCLLLLTLGLTHLDEVTARKIPKAGNTAVCPPLKDNNVRVDIRILNQKQGVSISSDIQNRSISPWNYNITQDPNRFPSEIANAECRYLNCLNAEGQEDSSLNSVPIQQEILVLRRDPQDCPHAFRLEKVLVKVGCTCVTPVISHIRGQRAAHQLS
ncbi:interleukin-17F [Erinaceus europaeus]|uniref:Interleukin-17A n=1 Tax=Erinaceus europaeus TaxID=9365 RepID=A0A1S2ZAZ1_ERIEU|nr:interleukin-17F [Erinaceus europaeus]